MNVRSLAALLASAILLGFPGWATAQDSTEASPAEPEGKAKSADTSEAQPKIEGATFGGGCFWCSEAVLERIPGVKSVVSGYAGGRVANPTYEMVGSGLTGHAEVVEVTYDASKVRFEELLKVFFKSHDPTTLNRQGPDYGPQYRSIILYHDEHQRQAASTFIKAYNAQSPRHPIVTEVVPFTAFYPAELYHQNYYRNHPNVPYSKTYIEPKVRKLLTTPK